MVQATLVAAIAAAVQFASPTLLSAEEVGRPALMIEIDGAIGPATARYVKEALTTAGERRDAGVLLPPGTPCHPPPFHSQVLLPPVCLPNPPAWHLCCTPSPPAGSAPATID